AGMAELNLNVYVDGVLHSNSPLLLLVGKTPVLMVDDDQGAGSNMEDFYTGIWDEQDIRYGVWDHSIQGSPPADFLAAFPIIVWMCEWAFPTLDDDDRESLQQYLDSGGNLYISGQDLGWDLNENPGTDDNISFFENYLHASWGGDHSGSMAVNGVFGDPIGHDLSFDIYQPGYPAGSQYPDHFYPDSEAVKIFEYDNGRTMGLRYSGDYKLVYTGVGLETFGSYMFSDPSLDINDVQRTVLNRILSYLNFIGHEAYTDTEDTTSNFDVSITITGDVADLSSVNLHYKNDNLSEFVEVAMADSGQGQYAATIPAPMNSSNIEYYIKIATTYYEWTNPVGAPTNSFLFYAGLDTISPVVLSVNSFDNRIDRSGLEQVISFVSDNIGVDSVHLNWSTNIDPSIIHRMPMISNGVSWVGDIVYENLPGNTTITYFVEAMDISHNNMGYSQPLSFTIVNSALLTAWEYQDVSGWDTGDGWGIQYINADNGYGMNDSPGGFYENNANNNLTLIEPYDLSDYNSAYLQFYSGALMVLNEDFGYIELSGNGVDWTTVSSTTGFNSMDLTTLDVSDYITDGVYIRFRMTSDSANAHQGWFIDDITLLVDTTIFLSSSSEISSLPAKFHIAQNYPNPFNPFTTIRYELPQKSEVQITIYDLLGRKVTTLVTGAQDAGYKSVQWDATDIA
ncbi:MAG: T9SS type A sorting domain-containing protein, partial [Candidatus Marinimicrobia bacterium]|nr:T9SS type A sorting domain-containing protein [Candidatus Neomarinimicrobiota bacterium]